MESHARRVPVDAIPEEVDLDVEPLTYHGQEYDAAGAEKLAQEILRRAGRAAGQDPEAGQP